MKYEWLESYCLSKQGAVAEFKAEWCATLYRVGNKMFGLLGQDGDGNEIFSIKLNVADGLVMREKYADIKPGYYLSKDHWNSIDLNGNLPDDVFKQLIDQSYELIFESLPKKVQKEISNS